MSRHSEIFTSQTTIRMSSQPFTWRCICLFGMYTISISVISMFYNTLSLLAVGSSLSSPMEWPDCFGSITDGYTISTFWGNLWHQMLSRHVIGYGRAAARGFGFQRGSIPYYVVLLVVGFAVSGLLHCGGDAMFGLRRLGSSLFIFQIQAFGIALEQSVIYTAKQLNWKVPGGRAVGFCWVIVWFYSTTSEFMSAQIETGVADEGPASSLSRRLGCFLTWHKPILIVTGRRSVEARTAYVYDGRDTCALLRQYCALCRPCQDLRSTLRSPSFYIPNLLLAFVLAENPAKRWRTVFMVMLTCTTLVGFRTTAGGPRTDYMLGCSLAELWLMALHLLFVVNPLHNYRHQSDKVHPTQCPYWYRVYWCFCVRVTVRGVGWNYQIRYIPPITQKYSRQMFVLTRILRMLGSILFLDVAQAAIALHPDVFSPSATKSFASQSFTFRSLGILMTAGVIMSGMGFSYNLVAVLAVCTHVQGPDEWPDYFGTIFEAYTVSGFWGRTWHQGLTRYVTGFGQAASRTLGFKNRSIAAYITLLVVAFAVSAFHHSGGDVMSVSPHHFGASMPFFVVQIAGITLEQLTVYTAGKLGLSFGFYINRVIGYLWVAFWFSLTAVPFIDDQMRAGAAHEDLIPFSPLRALLGRHV